MTQVVERLTIMKYHFCKNVTVAVQILVEAEASVKTDYREITSGMNAICSSVASDIVGAVNKLAGQAAVGILVKIVDISTVHGSEKSHALFS